MDVQYQSFILLHIYNGKCTQLVVVKPKEIESSSKHLSRSEVVNSVVEYRCSTSVLPGQAKLHPTKKVLKKPSIKHLQW